MPARLTDGFIAPGATTAWKLVETGPGNACVLTPAELVAATKLRVRCITPFTPLIQPWVKIGTASDYSGPTVAPPADLTPKAWANFHASDDFPLRDKDYTAAARVSWAGVYPTNLRQLVVVWDAPVTILDRTKIEVTAEGLTATGATVSSIEGRVMYLMLPLKVAIDGSTNATVTFKKGSVGVYGVTEDTNLKMYDTPALPESGVLLAADTLNDTTEVPGGGPGLLQSSPTEAQYIPAFYGTSADVVVTAQCWQQFEVIDVSKSCSPAVPPLNGWMTCLQLWGTTIPMDQFPPEQLFSIADPLDFGTGTFVASLVNPLGAGTTSSVLLDVLSAAGPPLRITYSKAVVFTPTAVSAGDTNQLPAGTLLTLSICADTAVTGNSSPVAGGSAATPTATAIVYGGNSPQTVAPFPESKPYIYSLARFPKPLDPARAVDWRELDLPVTFVHGDPIPNRVSPATFPVTPAEAQWPSGVGLARLCRGSPAVGASTWDADVYEATPLLALPSLPYFFGFTSAGGNSEAYVYFNKPPLAVSYLQVTLTDSGSPVTPAVTGATISGSKITLTFASAVVITATLGIRFEALALKTSQTVNSAEEVTDVYNTSAIDVPISTMLPGSVWHPPVPGVAGVAARDVIWSPAQANILYVHFTGPLATAPSPGSLTFTPSGITASSVTLDATDKSIAIYTLSAAPTDAQLTPPPVVDVASSGGTTSVQGDIPSIGTAPVSGLPFRAKLARNCYVLVCNRFTETEYTSGDVIDVATDSSFSLLDTQVTPNTRTAYDSRIRERITDDSAPSYPWVQILTKGGQRLLTTPSPVYGIKRKVGEAKATTWIHAPRRATATSQVVFGTGGIVSSVSVTDPGLGYVTPPAVTVAPPPPGGTQAVITATVVNTGRVEGAYITACGSGYSSPPLVSVAAPTPGGSPSFGQAILRDGKVVGVHVTGAGRGYLTAPAITFTGGGGSGAAATAVITAGGVTLAITNPGAGYVSSPAVTIAQPPQRPIPMPPSVADDTPAQWADGVGWGTIMGGSLTGGLIADGAVLIVHDDRSLVPWGLSGEGGGAVPLSRPPDSVLSWYQTRVRLTIADADADGVLDAWVPMGGGA